MFDDELDSYGGYEEDVDDIKNKQEKLEDE